MVKTYDIIDIVLSENENISKKSRDEIREICNTIDNALEINSDIVVECNAGFQDKVNITLSIPI